MADPTLLAAADLYGIMGEDLVAQLADLPSGSTTDIDAVVNGCANDLMGQFFGPLTRRGTAPTAKPTGTLLNWTRRGTRHLLHLRHPERLETDSGQKHPVRADWEDLWKEINEAASDPSIVIGGLTPLADGAEASPMVAVSNERIFTPTMYRSLG